MKILLINPTEQHGNRFLIPTFLGLYNLGHDITWLGTKMGGFYLVNKSISEDDMFDEVANAYPKASFAHCYTLDEAIKLVKESDLIVFQITHSPYYTYSVTDWVEILNKYRPYQYLLYDSRDNTSKLFGQNEVSQFKYKHYLQREAQTHIYPDIIKWNGLATCDLWNKKVNQDIFVSTTFPNTNDFNYYEGKSVRLKAMKALINYPEAYVLTNRISFEDHINLLNRSKVSISAPGAGAICYREYEILSTKKTVLALKESPVMDTLPDGSYMSWNSIEDLYKLLEGLKDKDRYDDVLMMQNEVVAKYCSPKAKALELIDIYNIEEE